MSYRVSKDSPTAVNVDGIQFQPGEAIPDARIAKVPAVNIPVLIKEGILECDGVVEKAPEAPEAPKLKSGDPEVSMQDKGDNKISPAELAERIKQERGSDEPTRTEEDVLADMEARAAEVVKGDEEPETEPEDVEDEIDEDLEDEEDLEADEDEDEDDLIDDEDEE